MSLNDSETFDRFFDMSEEELEAVANDEGASSDERDCAKLMLTCRVRTGLRKPGGLKKARLAEGEPPYELDELPEEGEAE